MRNAFREYEKEFAEITRRARDRFLARDWAGSYGDAAARLGLYTEVLDSLTHVTRTLLGSQLCNRELWTDIKAAYSPLIADSAGWEIGESFFNSLTRRVFATEGVDPSIEFVDTDFDPRSATQNNLQSSYGGRSLTALLKAALTNPSSGFPESRWKDLSSAAVAAASRLEATFAAIAGVI